MNLISTATVDMTVCNGLAIYQNSYWVVPITVCERVNLQDTPIDITGYRGVCTIKKHTSDDTPIAQPEVTISQEETGLFTLSLSSDLTANIPCRGKSFRDVEIYQYDVFLIDEVSQEAYKALQGIVEVVPSCTDADDEE